MELVINIIIPLFFIGIISKQLSYIKELLIPTSKTSVEIIIVLLGAVILLWITYTYAGMWNHYVIGALGIFMFISIWLKQGITAKGFLRISRGGELIPWNEITEVTIRSSKYIKITLTGRFLKQTLYFKKNDYDKIINLIKGNLPFEANLVMIDDTEN